MLRAALKNGLVVAEESWFEYADNREGGPPRYRYSWITNEDPYDRYKRLDKRIRENQVLRYEMAKRYSGTQTPLTVRTPSWSSKRVKPEPDQS